VIDLNRRESALSILIELPARVAEYLRSRLLLRNWKSEYAPAVCLTARAMGLS